MFPEMPLKLHFIKCSERNISQCILAFTFVFKAFSKFGGFFKNSYFPMRYFYGYELARAVKKYELKRYTK